MTTPVSGPGQFSQRTDRAVSAASESLPNAQYGENKDYQEMKSAAPMAGGDFDMGAIFGGGGAESPGFGGESTMPDVPVTDGAEMGPGAGPEVLNLPESEEADYLLAQLPALEYIANTGRSDAARNMIRQIKYSV